MTIIYSLTRDGINVIDNSDIQVIHNVLVMCIIQDPDADYRIGITHDRRPADENL